MEKRYKALSKMQLATMYGVSLTTLKSWLTPFEEEIGSYRGKCYTPKQVEKIFALLGEPKD